MKLFVSAIFILAILGCGTVKNKQQELPELSREKIQLSFSENSHLGR
jgi:hypothetical protein